MLRVKPGDIAYIVENNRTIREVKIVKEGAGLYTIRFNDGNGGTKLKAHRLFKTKEEAAASLKKTGW